MWDAPAKQARRVMWQNLESTVVRELIANDLDEMDRRFVAMAADLKQIKAVLVGLLVTFSTASIVGAVNLLFGGIP
jgi:glutamate/tyrosine decarboxylase-like PLP-dependent enzyme